LRQSFRKKKNKRKKKEKSWGDSTPNGRWARPLKMLSYYNSSSSSYTSLNLMLNHQPISPLPSIGLPTIVHIASTSLNHIYLFDHQYCTAKMQSVFYISFTRLHLSAIHLTHSTQQSHHLISICPNSNTIYKLPVYKY